MTLTEFFAAIQNPNNVLVAVTETDNGSVKQLARVFADGYEQLLSALLSRTVDEITIVNATNVTVHLAAAG